MIDYRIQSLEKKPLEHMPLCKPWDHAIDLVLDFRPIESYIYPCSPTEQEEMLSLTINWLKITFILRHRTKLQGYSSFPKRMKRNKWYKITDTSILKPLKIINCSL